MSDRRALVHADEQALAEAMHGIKHKASDRASCQFCRAEAAAIYATPAMQAIARDAAVGRAVERLGDDFTIHARSQSRYGKAVHVERVGHPPPVIRDNLKDALAAALGEDDAR